MAFAATCAPFFFTPGFSEDEWRLRINPIYGDLSLFFDRMLTPRGLLEKPVSNLLLSLLSQVDDYRRWPFLLVAIVAHAVNVGLLVRFGRALGFSRSLGALVFLVHPLALHASITCFGITYSIPLALCLLGLTRVLHEPRSSRSVEIGVHTGIYVGLLLLKQSFVVYPVLLLALLVWQGRLELRRQALVGSAVVGALALGVVYLYWRRYGQLAHYEPLGFALGQLGSLPRTALLYLFPPYYQFEQELDAQTQAWSVVLGTLMVVSALVVLVRWRRSPVAIAGVLAVLLLLPTNSVMPREQLVLKWRLYPSLALLCLALGGVLERLAEAKGPRQARWLPRASLVVAGIVLIGSSCRDAWLLSSESRYMGSLARRLPRPSYLAFACAGLVREQQHERAKICVVRLEQAAQESMSGHLALSFFTELARAGLMRRDTALVHAWLGSLAAPPSYPAPPHAPRATPPAPRDP